MVNVLAKSCTFTHSTDSCWNLFLKAVLGRGVSKYRDARSTCQYFSSRWKAVLWYQDKTHTSTDLQSFSSFSVLCLRRWGHVFSEEIRSDVGPEFSTEMPLPILNYLCGSNVVPGGEKKLQRSDSETQTKSPSDHHSSLLKLTTPVKKTLKGQTMLTNGFALQLPQSSARATAVRKTFVFSLQLIWGHLVCLGGKSGISAIPPHI